MPIYVPGKVVLQKEFTQQSYMWEFPAQYGLWSPANITTALWLDAADAGTITESGGAVSQWNDKSGNNRHATQSDATRRPAFTSSALNGYSALTFDGTNDGLTCGDAFHSANLLIFAVAKTSNATAEQNIVTKWNGTGNQREFIFRFRSTNKVGAFFSFDGSSANSSFLDTTGTAGTGWTIGGAVRNGTALTVSLNGSQNSSTLASSSLFNSTASLDIGYFFDGSNVFEPLNGQIATVVIATNPSLADLQKLEGWAAHKYGLTANLPNDHPYKTVGPTP
jgi:hypothetical protein